jgi:hypothetical protein
MAENNENNLRDEEQTGFQPGAPDDDSFLLNGKEKYPGELPDFELKGEQGSEVVPKKPVSLQSDKISEAEQIEPPKHGTVWDLFDGSQPDESQETTTGESPLPPLPTYVEKEEKPDVVPPHQSMELEREEHEFIPRIKEEEEAAEELPPPVKTELEAEEHLTSEPLEKESEEAETIPKAEEPAESETAEEPVKLDDELAALIKSDLEKTKKPKVQAEEAGAEGQLAVIPVVVTDEEVQAKLEQFKPVEDNEPTEEIDLLKIGFGETPASEAVAKEPVSELAKEPEEEKKERKLIVIPWRNIGISSAAAILLIAIGIGAYSLLWNRFLISQKQEKPVGLIAKKTVKTKEIPKEKPKQIVTDTTKTAQKADTSKPKAMVETKIKKKEETGTALAAVDLAKKKAQEKKVIPVKQVKPKEETKKTIQKPVLASMEKKTETVPKSTKTEEKPLVNNKMVFTVQVYTSPSKDDAEDWLRILKRKNINDGFISTQKIRDKIWYRVRFGLFGTREEAQASAVKLGFDQIWIDRVR